MNINNLLESAKSSTEEFKNRVHNLVGDEYTVLGEYVNSSTKIKMKHNKCGHEYEVTPHNFLQGNKCPKCSGKIKKSTDQFKQEVKDLVGDEYTVLGEYINSHSKIKMKHNKCGYEYEVRPHDFLQGSRCPKCYGNIKKSTDQFKQEVHNLVGDEYTVLGEYVNSSTKIKMKHNKCGHEYEVVPNSFLRGNRCPKCAHKHKNLKENLILNIKNNFKKI